MGSLQATRYKKNGTGEFLLFAKLAGTQIGSKRYLNEQKNLERKIKIKRRFWLSHRTQNSPQNLCLLKAIPFTTLPLFLFLDFFVIINHLRIMLSTISNYFSAFKKKHYDDLTDFDKGKLHGTFSTHMYFFALGMTFELYGAYKGMR